MLRRILDEVVDGRRTLEERIDTVQSRVEQFRDETLSNFDGVLHRLENVESELSSISAGLARVERELPVEASRREQLRVEIGELRTRLARLEERLDELDTRTSKLH